MQGSPVPGPDWIRRVIIVYNRNTNNGNHGNHSHNGNNNNKNNNNNGNNSLNDSNNDSNNRNHSKHFKNSNNGAVQLPKLSAHRTGRSCHHHLNRVFSEVMVGETGY